MSKLNLKPITTWTATPRHNELGAYTIDNWVEHEHIARVGTEYTSKDKAAEHAAQLAAAPVMLAALKKWKAFLVDNYVRADCPDLWDSTHGAVAMATMDADQLQREYERVIAAVNDESDERGAAWL